MTCVGFAPEGCRSRKRFFGSDNALLQPPATARFRAFFRRIGRVIYAPQVIHEAGVCYCNFDMGNIMVNETDGKADCQPNLRTP